MPEKECETLLQNAPEIVEGTVRKKTHFQFLLDPRSISPIIAVLLLLLITIEASVMAYSYVMGFVGNSESTPQPMEDLVSIDNFCASSVM